MKYLEPNVVIVDDKIDEIKGLIDHYRSQGIGCKYFNADLNNGDNYPDKQMSDVMLLFLDLYYSDGPLDSGFDPELSTSWVRSIIHPGAFYILILWTKDSAQAELVTNKLDKLNLHPFQTLIESKGSYAIDKPEKYDYDKLFNSITARIEETPEIEEILIWKNTIKRACNVVLGGLISPEVTEFTNKLQKIITCHGGEIISQAEDSQRKRSTLFEALNNVLISNAPQYDSEVEISKKNETNLYKVSDGRSTQIDNQLNSWFHFTLKNDLNDKIAPGIIAINNNADLQKYYSIKDDPSVMKSLSEQLNSKQAVIDDIVLNITRPCDYAQNKYGKNLKLLSGLLIKKPEKNKKQDCKTNGPAPDCLVILDHLYLDKDEPDVTLVFDLRYSFSVPESIFPETLQNIKMLNKELLSEIQVKYSSYCSRLGYTKIY